MKSFNNLKLLNSTTLNNFVSFTVGFYLHLYLKEILKVAYTFFCTTLKKFNT